MFVLKPWHTPFSTCTYNLLVLNHCYICRLNPDWNPQTRSTFLLACPSKELFDVGLTFKINDWDLVGGDDPLGTVRLDGYDLYHDCRNGALQEHKISPPKWARKKNMEDAGTLIVRCRPATKSDYDSLKNKEKKNLFWLKHLNDKPVHWLTWSIFWYRIWNPISLTTNLSHISSQVIRWILAEEEGRFQSRKNCCATYAIP